MIDVTIHLITGSKESLYQQIYEYFKEEIQSANCIPGEKLPSTRMLAKKLQISRNTVDMAYEQLEAEGYIESIPCSGYYVNNIEDLYCPPKVHYTQGGQAEKEDIYWDFTKSDVDLSHFPFQAWRKVNKKVFEQETSIFQAGDAFGEPGLRNAIASYLHQARGVNCKAENIIVGAGNEYLLLLLRTILKGELIVGMENPTYYQAYHAMHSAGCTMEAIEMDDSGILVSELKQTKANLVYVMPSHQFPIGAVMPISRRMELLAWANEGERYIIEDDYDSEFRYKGRPIPALQGYDRMGKVIYLGTFSKSIAPAIRVSYMVLPEKLMIRYKEECGLFSITVSKMQQELITQFLNEGYFERNLNKMRTLYKGKRDLLLNQLKYLPENCRVYGENAGLHLLVEIDTPNSESHIIHCLKEEKMKVEGLQNYYIGKKKEEYKPTLILNYGHLEPEEIRKSTEKLQQVLREEAPIGKKESGR
ncbi:MAG: PLP-dependent aminotransferase family protein [Lachnospiraceae bacterium]